MFFTTINRTWAAYALVVVAAERLARVAPVGAHDWQKFISPQQLQRILADSKHRLDNDERHVVKFDD